MRTRHSALEAIRRRLAEPDPRPENFWLRDSEAFWLADYFATEEFASVADEFVSQLDLGQRRRDKNKELARCIIHNLVMGRQTRKTAACSRNTSIKGVDAIVKMFDQFRSVGLARCCIGSEQSRKVTRYEATDDLYHPFKHMTARQMVSTQLARNTKLGEPLAQDRKRLAQRRNQANREYTFRCALLDPGGHIDVGRKGG